MDDNKTINTLFNVELVHHLTAYAVLSSVFESSGPL